MEEIVLLDEFVFRLINVEWQNSLFDALLPFWRNKVNWIPLYSVMTALLFYKLKVKGVYIILALAVTIGITDTVSSQVIKKTVKRERPCRALESSELRIMVPCGGGYSFTSSHSVNHFAVAVFLIMTSFGVFGKYRFLLLPWALLVAYAQVYVGVHYPLDVICGALLGSLIAYFTGRLTLRGLKLKSS